MAKEDIKELVSYTKKNEKSINERDMKYDSGQSAMVYTRGNVLLGKRRFLTSLKVGSLRKILMDMLF